MNESVKKIIFLIYYLVIIFLSTSDFNVRELRPLYSFFEDKDKFMHFFQYFILVALAVFTFKVTFTLRNFVLMCLFIMFSSGISEFIQLYLSTRNSSYIDWSYDVLGGVCSFFIFTGIRHICYKD